MCCWLFPLQREARAPDTYEVAPLNSCWRWMDEQPREYLKDVAYHGFWWTNTIPKFQIQLTHNALVKLIPTMEQAVHHAKPYTFFIVNDVRAKWRHITSKRGAELYISQYGNDVWTAYDPRKIQHLATNSVSTYYTWAPLPAPLKTFLSTGTAGGSPNKIK